MENLTYDILNALFFVEPYEKLKNEIPVPEPVLKDELKRLISLGWIQVMQWNEQAQDFLPAEIFDSHSLENYSFLITFEGLNRLNSRNPLT